MIVVPTEALTTGAGRADRGGSGTARRPIAGRDGAMASGKSDSVLPHPAVFAATYAVTAVAWTVAGLLWSSGNRPFAVSAFALGLSLGPCLTAYATSPRLFKQLQRRVVLFTGGVSVLAPALLGAGSLDIEGFFAALFSGTAGAAVGHTVVTVIAGPLVFGRVLCGWGCWRAMVLELLPPWRGTGRRWGAWALLPYVGLATSAGASAVCVHALGHRPPSGPPGPGAAVLPVLIACLVYWAASISLALALKDQRAFCKYLCPNSAILRWTSRPARLRIAARASDCDGCGACTRECPMDIDVAEMALAGQRIGSGECVLCQRCVHACPRGALRLTFQTARGSVPNEA
jgi:ferredoxin-type protein NapH